MSRPPETPPRVDAGLGKGGSQIEIVASDRFGDRAAELIADLLRQAVAAEGAATLMLAGGSTPRAAYERLACQPLPWPQVSVFFGDERAVAATHPESNYAMVRAALLDRLSVAPARVQRMAADTELASAAAEYARLLPPQVDVLILGIGEDGHTASLFPHSTALSVRGSGVVPVTAPKPPPQRLSITPDVIRTAKCCVVLASGPAKAEAVARALSGLDDVMSCPAQLARGRTWVLDPAAAALLAS